MCYIEYIYIKYQNKNNKLYNMYNSLSEDLKFFLNLFFFILTTSEYLSYIQKSLKKEQPQSCHP